MTEQFDKLNEALDRLEKTLENMRNENGNLRREIAELKSVVEDRDIEIVQLQEDAAKAAEAAKAEKNETDGCLNGILERMNRLAATERSAGESA